LNEVNATLRLVFGEVYSSRVSASFERVVLRTRCCNITNVSSVPCLMRNINQGGYKDPSGRNGNIKKNYNMKPEISEKMKLNLL
jgi:hypothetical protein